MIEDWWIVITPLYHRSVSLRPFLLYSYNVSLRAFLHFILNCTAGYLMELLVWFINLSDEAINCFLSKIHSIDKKIFQYTDFSSQFKVLNEKTIKRYLKILGTKTSSSRWLSKKFLKNKKLFWFIALDFIKGVEVEGFIYQKCLKNLDFLLYVYWIMEKDKKR